MALGYTLVGLLVGGGLIVASAIVGVVWLVVSAARPELMEAPAREEEG